MPDHRQNLPPILSPGTQVVAEVPVIDPRGVELRPAGHVGVIVRSPESVEGPYLVRFADGGTESFRRAEIAVLRADQDGALGDGPTEDLFRYVIYRCVVGSRAYGLDHEHSDTDLRGIYLPPARLEWSLVGVPEQIERRESEECYWELAKFLTLALKGNPTVLECLFTPIVIDTCALAERLRGMRRAFLSRYISKTYSGYVLSQHKRMHQRQASGGEILWKHAMHLLRLLDCGAQALLTGEIDLSVGDRRELFLAVKRGEVTWERWNDLHREYQARFEDAAKKSTLPERPDFGAVNELLIDARRAMVDR